MKELQEMRHLRIKRRREEKNEVAPIEDLDLIMSKDKRKKKRRKERFNEENKNNESFLQRLFKQEDNFIIESKNRKRIVPKAYAEYILNKNKLIYLNDQLYKFDEKEGFYKALSKHEIEVLIAESIKSEHDNLLVDYDIIGISHLIKIQPEIQYQIDKIPENNMFINVKNGVLDLIKNQIYEHDSKYYFFYCINAKYKTSFNKDKFEKSEFYKFINSITKSNKELIKLLQEVIGYSISSINNAKKFFIFYGVPNSGKSTLLDLLQYIVGEEYVSNVPLQKLNDDKYSAELYNKLLNIYNELPDEGLTDLGKIKSLVSANDKIISRKLYSQPFSFRNKATLIFATNSMPELKTKLYQDNTAFFNRMIIVPFLNSISEDKQDKELFEKLKRERNYIFTWAVIGIKRYIKNGYRFSECEVSKSFLEKYKNDEDLISTFINERIVIDKDDYVFFTKIKEVFRNFCKENGKNYINAKEYKYLKESIEFKFEIKYKKVHKNSENKWGFKGISII